MDCRVAELARDNTCLTALKTYVQAVAPEEADKLQAIAQKGAGTDQADAQSLADYQVLEGFQYASALSAWALDAGTPWATYQADLANAASLAVAARADAWEAVRMTSRKVALAAAWSAARGARDAAEAAARGAAEAAWDTVRDGQLHRLIEMLEEEGSGFSKEKN